MMKLPIKTKRLYITEFDESMAESVHQCSLDEDNRRFLADEVFKTVGQARDVICKLKEFYTQKNAPLVYPVLLKNGTHIGHVQTVPFGAGWEIGYHVAKQFTGQGYATEAVSAFLSPVMEHLGISEIYGVCHDDNAASVKVLKKCGFVLEFHGLDYLQGKKQMMYRFKYTTAHKAKGIT